MQLVVTRRSVRIEDRQNHSDLCVTSVLPPAEVGEILRARRLGFTDVGSAFVNSLWLRDLYPDHAWVTGIVELLSFAECHGRFDGVYLEARIRRTSAGSAPLLVGVI